VVGRYAFISLRFQVPSWAEQLVHQTQTLDSEARTPGAGLLVVQVWKDKALRKAAAFFSCHTTAKAFQVRGASRLTALTCANGQRKCFLLVYWFRLAC